MQLNPAKAIWEPYLETDDPCEACEGNPCLQVCPSFEENFSALAGWTDASQTVGPYEEIYTTYSTSEAIRTRASSGGIIKELCRYYLENKLVDGVITLRHDEGLEYSAALYDSVQDVINTPGSIYHNINFENAIEILKTTSGEFLLIATPCQLTSITKWMQVCPDQVVGNLKVTIGLICGWQFTRHTLKHFCRSVGINYDQLTDATYRGGDAHGKLMLQTGDETRYFNRRTKFGADKHHFTYRTAFSRTYNSQRCLLCVEHVNFLADIVVGDAWLERNKDDKLGTSIIIIRNADRIQDIQALVEQGNIEIQSATEEDIVESQSPDLAYGISARQIIRKLKQQGKFAPMYTLPLPDVGMPSLKIWWKNYLTPKLFRSLTWNGFGYPWFRWRVLMRKVSLIFSLPMLGLRFISRKLFKSS